MKDGIIKNTGNSRKLKSSISPDTTWAQFLAALISGNLPIDLNGIIEEGWTQTGTPLNKANLLSDTTATALGLAGNPTVNDALNKLAAHRNRHASGGADALSPADIGAVNKAGDTMSGALTLPFGGLVMKNGGTSVPTDGGRIFLQKANDSPLSGDVYIDNYLNVLRIAENGGSFRGVYIDIAKGPGGITSKVYHSNDKPTPAEINAYPFGLITLSSEPAVLSLGRGYYFFQGTPTAGHDFPDELIGYWGMYHIFIRGESDATNAHRTYHIYEAISRREFINARKYDSYSGWAKAYNTINKPTPAEIGAARVVTGSYVGTDGYGRSNPTVLTMGFTPKVVLIHTFNKAYDGILTNYPTVFIYNSPTVSFTGGYVVYVTWSSNGLSWYSDASAYGQLNASDYLYRWVAIG